MAPRVHNSGHWTIEGAVASQFENHIRAVAGLPLGDTGAPLLPVTMRNLIGREIEGVPALLAGGTCHVHHYGKAEVRAGRKLRSEEHTSELQALMRISYAVFC